jgi:hypothetical protein
MENILESKLSVSETVKLTSSTENDNLVCPITLQPIHDPVAADDGHIYEGEAIVQCTIQNETNAVNVPTVTRVSPNLKRKPTQICSSDSPVFDQANDANGQRCSNKWHKGKYRLMIITFLCIILIVIPVIRGLYG